MEPGGCGSCCMWQRDVRLRAEREFCEKWWLSALHGSAIGILVLFKDRDVLGPHWNYSSKQPYWAQLFSDNCLKCWTHLKCFLKRRKNNFKWYKSTPQVLDIWVHSVWIILLLILWIGALCFQYCYSSLMSLPCLFEEVLEIKEKTLHTLDKRSSTELWPQPRYCSLVLKPS